VSAYIEQHGERFGVEPICSTLGVSASAYYHRRSGERSTRAVEDERLLGRIRQTHAKNFDAYGYRRTWKALLRAGETAPLPGAAADARAWDPGSQASRQAVADHNA